MSPLLARLSLVIAAILFSGGGAGIKEVDFTPWQIAGLRSLAAAAALTCFLPRVRTRWTRRAWMVGLVYATTMVLFVLANRATTAANTVFLQSTAPLYILVLGPWLLKERFRGADLVTIVLMGVGLTLFFLDPERPQETAPEPFTGNVMAMTAGVTWALTVIGLRWMGRVGDVPMTGVVAGNLLAFVFALPFLFPLVPAGSEAAIGTSDWLIVASLGVFQIGLAYVFLDRGLEHVPALEASLLLLVEPVLNPLWAWIFHAERPGNWAIVGGALILGASVLRASAEGVRRSPSVDQSSSA